MSGRQLKAKRSYILTFRNFILMNLLWIALANADDYDNSNDYEYEYYNDYDQLYDGEDINGQAELNEYDDYDDSDGIQLNTRTRKDTEKSNPNWMDDQTFIKLGAKDCVQPTRKPTTRLPPTPRAECERTTTCVPATTECLPEIFNFASIDASELTDQEARAKDVRTMVQRLYVAQARVQLEASEIKKAQAIANEAQQQLEEAANHVRAITAALQNAQQEVASTAVRAQTAQLQLAAHDQLLFAARQDVDALSSQMVGLQAAEGIAQPKASFDISALMEKLRQPLLKASKPTAVPVILPGMKTKKEVKSEDYYYDDYSTNIEDT